MTDTQTHTPAPAAPKANGKGKGKAEAAAPKADAKASAPKVEAPKVDRYATTVAGANLSATARKAWIAKVTAHVATLGLKPKATANYTALITALADAKSATNSWQLSKSTNPKSGTLDIAEGTLYAAITKLHDAKLITRVNVGRSHFYVPAS